MIRSSKRRQASELKKMLDKMSLSEVQEFITQIYVDGVNNTIALHKEALNEIYGFGEGRYNRIYEYISLKLVKNKEKEKTNCVPVHEDENNAI
ncbi:hypothetical protein Curi_c24300 [Gottschalkia acidurici 9a]|uniref:Uncharacterized protein n=1 Tax=Gottschalkia acidurici (strain ATCC 7906 / DSM 604 / BCRC 14475 / CIP 104303 / KCTC 5404 / NCIMB 10678 / 9a) TaxID=1128398 RepID=K0B3K1_GOTA9|nr:hypothetical protein [Gottschalkia acidurici]AFS79425.1 hypothetical protein Curi_c24300 [Gottschalkia acidurici 9a]